MIRKRLPYPVGCRDRSGVGPEAALYDSELYTSGNDTKRRYFPIRGLYEVFLDIMAQIYKVSRK
jgi:hypothetical protein